jgi:Helix-turn-helix domain
MAGEVIRRRELHDFLRAARARLQSRAISASRRPRSGGTGALRQADMAAALSVSHRWYNDFENGAAASASPNAGKESSHVR